MVRSVWYTKQRQTKEKMGGRGTKRSSSSDSQLALVKIELNRDCELVTGLSPPEGFTA